MSASHLKDEELWKAILSNDHAAFKILFDRYWSKVYTTAYHHLKDKEACKEITHEIFLNIWVRRQHLHITSFSAYLRTAAKYHVYKHVRRTRLIPISYNSNLEEVGDQYCLNQGDENMHYLELENNVNEYLQSLPERCQYIFRLSRQQHLSNEQIAGKLGISKRTVENQLTHALHHLRSALKNISVGAWIIYFCNIIK